MTHSRPIQPTVDAVGAALRQAARQRRRGDFRKAMQLLKQAAFQSDGHPGLWNRYALACMSTGKREEARKAFAQAAWLQERAGQVRGAEITRRLEALAEQGELPVNYSRKNTTPWTAFALNAAERKAAPPTHAYESWHPHRKIRSKKIRRD